MKTAIHMTVSRDIELRISYARRDLLLGIKREERSAFILADLIAQGKANYLVARTEKMHPHDIFYELKWFSSPTGFRTGTCVEAVLNGDLRTVRPNDMLTEILRRAD